MTKEKTNPEEVHDAEFVEQPPAESSLAIPPAESALAQQVNEAGAIALANMSEEEFEQRLSKMKRSLDRTDRIHREMMKENVDYGIIPGTKKPTLLKPGAEILCGIYRLVPDFIVAEQIGDGASIPHVSYKVRCELHLGDLSGPVVGVGNGICHSFEIKYRYRQAQRLCPNCQQPAIMESKYEPGFYCYDKRGGCKAKFRPDDERITGQILGKIDNPDPIELKNTMLKMAEKRSQIDAVLRATSASRLFTQDVEDFSRPPATDLNASGAPPSSRTHSPPSEPPKSPPQASKPAVYPPPAAPATRPPDPPAKIGLNPFPWHLNENGFAVCTKHNSITRWKSIKKQDGSLWEFFGCTSKDPNGYRGYCDTKAYRHEIEAMKNPPEATQESGAQQSGKDDDDEVPF